MKINFFLNGKKVQEEIAPDLLLLDLLRQKGCYSVKRGCETANCGLCMYLWTKSQSYLVVCLQPERMAKRL